MLVEFGGMKNVSGDLHGVYPTNTVVSSTLVLENVIISPSGEAQRIHR